MIWVVLIATIVLAVFESYWWWLLAAPVTYWAVVRFCLLNGAAWRRVHFPFMRAYSAAAGICVAKGIEGDDCVQAALELVLMAKPIAMESNHASTFIAEQFRRFRDFEDEGQLALFIKNSQTSLTPDFKNKIQSLFSLDDPGIHVRSVIAGIIERKHGEEARLRYLWAILQGKAT